VVLATPIDATVEHTKAFNTSFSEVSHRSLACLSDVSIDAAVNWLTRAMAACQNAELASVQQEAADKAAAVKAKALLDDTPKPHVQAAPVSSVRVSVAA
jgi:hypothetical protein